jgi:hypothetical protein
MIPAPPPPAPIAGGAFPIPLVGTVAILIVLIVFTPILFATGPPAAGTFETQGELVVDQVAPGANLTFYVHAVGDTVRYARISIGVDALGSWSGGCPSSGLVFAPWENRTGVLESSRSTADDPVAVSVSALYSADGSSANYSAVVAVDSSGGSVSIAACSGATPPSGPVAVASLPLVLLLAEHRSGGSP